MAVRPTSKSVSFKGLSGKAARLTLPAFPRLPPCKSQHSNRPRAARLHTSSTSAKPFRPACAAGLIDRPSRRLARRRTHLDALVESIDAREDVCASPAARERGGEEEEGERAVSS